MDYTHHSLTSAPDLLAKVDSDIHLDQVTVKNNSGENHPLLQTKYWATSRPSDHVSFQPCSFRLISTMLTLAFTLLLALYHVSSVSAVNTIVRLDYASYQGASNNGVTRWLGMRYAAPPTGNLRFALPQDPRSVSGVQTAVQVRW